MTIWRLLRTDPADAATNMALDEALLDRARETGEAVLRVYEWAAPSLSLGRNQSAAGWYGARRAAALGVAVVRRLTGGRAVVHARELTYSVTAPVVAGEPLRESYARINAVLVRALRRLGVAAEVAAARGATPRPDAAPCFEAPTAGELVVRGRKLVGSAQWRDDGALLQHGSVLVDDDQALLAELALRPLPPPPPAATLRAELGAAPSAAAFLDALGGAVRELEDRRAAPLAADGALWARAAGCRARYLDDAWTWRR
ncbi:MAG: Lipoate-protein ligase A [uncultured Gemmatimonadaceae bacterium]|uniref:Lipoate-protein ligase A n=1 Tax=uncultured Gemmatimonadaceae bacterium TaxID=246130 RepID=A0A6J4M494_9BACT|nr:MAG: Lipoate-protein ligase A [uncultured Gemmatimonadaceae bacterium]